MTFYPLQLRPYQVSVETGQVHVFGQAERTTRAPKTCAMHILGRLNPTPVSTAMTYMNATAW